MEKRELSFSERLKEARRQAMKAITEPTLVVDITTPLNIHEADPIVESQERKAKRDAIYASMQQEERQKRVDRESRFQKKLEADQDAQIVRQQKKVAREAARAEARAIVLAERAARVNKVKATAKLQVARNASNRVAKEQQIKHYNKVALGAYTTSEPNDRGETPVRIDKNTVIYVKAGRDIETSVRNYHEREAIKRNQY